MFRKEVTGGQRGNVTILKVTEPVRGIASTRIQASNALLLESLENLSLGGGT